MLMPTYRLILAPLLSQVAPPSRLARSALEAAQRLAVWVRDPVVRLFPGRSQLAPAVPVAVPDAPNSGTSNAVAMATLAALRAR